jgi:hypothetical protein
MSILLLACLFVWPGTARAATLADRSGHFTLELPEGWEVTDQDFRQVRPGLAEFFDCLDVNAAELRFLGWLPNQRGEGNQAVSAAFCVTYRPQGLSKAGRIVRESSGKQREEASARFIDVFVSKIHDNYAKRKLKLEDLSADLIEAGNDLVLVLDSRINSPVGPFMRSTTAVLHGDGIVEIAMIYAPDAPKIVTDQLDALSQSLNWLKN